MATGKGDIGKMSASGAKLFAMINMGVAAGPDLLRVGERMPVTANPRKIDFRFKKRTLGNTARRGADGDNARTGQGTRCCHLAIGER